MGKLAIYGAIAGAGKGLSGMAKRELDEQERMAADARQYQMQRQRDKAAQEQRAADAEAAESRLQTQLTAQSEQLQTRITAQETQALTQQEHEMKIEEMRQNMQTARERMRITEKEDRFIRDVTPSSQTMTAEGIKTVPAQNTITDKLSNTTFYQDGQMFVPMGQEKPPARLIQAGEKSKKFLLNAPNQEVADQRMLQFLRIYKYLPPDFFVKWGGWGSAGKVTERGATTTTQPAAQ